MNKEREIRRMYDLLMYMAFPEKARVNAFRKNHSFKGWLRRQRYSKSERGRANNTRKNLTRKKNKPLYRGFCGRKHAAKISNIPFTITYEGLPHPKFCPALNIELRYGGSGAATANSASIDRIRPELGYIPGNVAVISNLANTIKQNANPTELRKIADWLEKQLCPTA